MECRACVKWFGVPLALALTTYCWVGCSQSDLSGYHRVVRQPAAPKAENDAHDVSGTPQTASTTAAEQDESPAKTPIAATEDMPVSALLPVNVVDGGNLRAVISIPTGNAQSDTGSIGSRSNLSPEAATPSEPRQIELLVKEKSFRTEPKTGALRVSFDDLDLLKILNMEPVVPNAEELMPQWLRDLDGKTVRIRGFMIPTFDLDGIERFVLARDNQICCFGRDPKIYDLIQVDMKTGKSTYYIPYTRAFDVVGKFRIQLQFEDGKALALYAIEQADVIDR